MVSQIQSLRALIADLDITAQDKQRAFVLLNEIQTEANTKSSSADFAYAYNIAKEAYKEATNYHPIIQKNVNNSESSTAQASHSSFSFISSATEDEPSLGPDYFSLGINGSKVWSVCLILVAAGYLAPNVLHDRQTLIIGRATFLFGHILAFLLYKRVIWKINESYTSYRGDNDYGYTNVEKAEIRAEVTRIYRVLLFRAILAGLVHYLFLQWVTPLLVTSTLGFGTLLNNPHFVDIFWNPFKLKRPVGFIPRSVSGRLL